MTEEEALDVLVNSIADYVIGEYCEHCADFKICEGECYFQQAIDKVAEKIQNQDTEINKLNNVIDRMAEVIEECRQNDCIETTEDLDMSEIAGVEKIKEYFMKENTGDHIPRID